MNTRLSTPSTISRMISVNRPIQIEGSETQCRFSHSMGKLLQPCQGDGRMALGAARSLGKGGEESGAQACAIGEEVP